MQVHTTASDQRLPIEEIANSAYVFEMKTDATIPLGRLDRSKPQKADFAMDAEGLRAIAALNEWRKAKKITLRGEFLPTDEGWELNGNIEAEVVLTCVVSGAPVPYSLNFPIRRVYLKNHTETPDDFSWDSDFDVDVEPLPRKLDLVELISEAIILELPEYPKAEEFSKNSSFSYSTNMEDVGDEMIEKPFANLKAMMEEKKRKET